MLLTWRWQSFVVLFAICFLPMHIFFLWFYFDPDVWSNYNKNWHIVKIIGFCLAYTNSCINPIALYCVSTSFRKYFNRILFCCQSQSDDHHGTDASIPMSHYNSQQHRRTASSIQQAKGRGLNTQSSVMLTSVSTRRPTRCETSDIDTVTNNQTQQDTTAADCHLLKSLSEEQV